MRSGDTRIVFSAEQAATALWTYGEDDAVDRALAMSDAELRRAWRLAGSHWRTDHELPIDGQLRLDLVTALACIELWEGAVRPLARSRRRPSRDRPERLRDPAGPPSAAEIVDGDRAGQRALRRVIGRRRGRRSPKTA